MLNQVSLIGSVKESYRIEDDYYVLIEVTRSYKNSNGEFDKDCIKCKIRRGKERIVKYAKLENRFISVAGSIINENDDFLVYAYELDLVG